jgi:AraC-like DNA-binding protein
MRDTLNLQVSPSTILFVKNNSHRNESIQAALESDYLLTSACGFDYALKSIIAKTPDVVLISAEFNGVKSIELCRCLKNNLQTSHIPIVLLAHQRSTDFKYKCLEVGADALINNNESPQLMNLQIKNLLENRRTLKFHYENKSPFSDLRSNYSLDQLFLNRVQVAVMKNYSDADYNVARLVEELSISRSNLYTRLKALTGLSTSAYIRLFRLKKGAELLKKGYLNVSQVAYNVGLNDPKYFSKSFKKLYGMTPSEFQRGEKVMVQKETSTFIYTNCFLPLMPSGTVS